MQSRKPPQRVQATGRGPHRRGASPSGEESTRQCAVCREKRPALQLLQLGSGVQVAPGKRGRNAYVCIALPCLQGLQGRSLGKAFKGTADGPAPGLAEIEALAEAKIYGLIGLARRQGALVPGVERLRDGLVPVGAVLVAHDAASRSQRQLPEAPLFGTMESLGQAAGLGLLAALGIQAGRLAMQAAYWLRVWYESRAREAAAVTPVPGRIEVA